MALWFALLFLNRLLSDGAAWAMVVTKNTCAITSATTFINILFLPVCQSNIISSFVVCRSWFASFVVHYEQRIPNHERRKYPGHVSLNRLGLVLRHGWEKGPYSIRGDARENIRCKYLLVKTVYLT